MVKTEHTADKKSEDAAVNEPTNDRVVKEDVALEADAEENRKAEATETAAGPLDAEAKRQAEVHEAKDKYLRLYSEFENYRRRTAKEKLELIHSANERLIQGLLPILDDFERAEQSMAENTDVQSVKEGISLIYHKFKSTLEQQGLQQIAVDQGADFDLELHEAITQIPAPEEALKGKIVDVVEKGYQLHEKVIRFCKVVTGA